ncbi:hypothetical protein GCM10009111_02800 [Colwellia asteriadis]|uniref:YceK/YidQ family lipoprotein n=1 Tax=Colwellia asteriadis TaxID=517723 RepID=A0ABN1L2P2_9GAMM
MRKFLFFLINIIVLLSTTGCVSIGTLGEKEHNNKVFSGTIRHMELACAHGICVDFPFSLVTDTVLLPVTIPWSIYNVSTDSAEKYMKSQELSDGNVPELIKRKSSE